ncbi:UPF0262 family protein [Rhodomicrobium sp.]|jgi:uncharacterized protein (UPF0262 family)|uniref:UPF0262 family protein n=1 Tax=Rhodomicrobium sp. TaxID=2720632 RepID=UPI0039E24B81
MPERTEADPSARLIEVNIDEASMGANALEIEHERRVAIFDLLEENTFELLAGPRGPYKLDIAMIEQKLVLAVRTNGAAEADATFILSLNPFRRLVKDYFLICESYFEAIKTAPPSRIEALDMARRALHDDGSKLLQERLEGKVRMDSPTSRRLFTLLCALHWRG